MSLVRPELPTASVGSSQATTAAVDNSALFAICPKSTYKSGNAVQTSGATSKAYFSTVLDRPSEAVWALERDFNDYPRYIDGVDQSVMEDKKSGDSVGAVRSFRYGGE